MNQMIEWINQNVGVTMLITLVVGLVLIGLLLSRASKRNQRSVERRLVEYERRRQDANGELMTRLQDDSTRTTDMQQRLFEMQTQSIQNSEQRISHLSDSLDQRQEGIQRTLNERISSLQESNEQRQSGIQHTLNERLGALQESNEQRQVTLQNTFNERLSAMQSSNEQRLDQMRQMVDEKLTTTLDKRLGESFKRVSDQLESVHKGLGEMQALAGGVGDLKRVLTGVKTRGIWGEVRLGALLEQNLTPSQYQVNAQVVPNSQERVEFAVVLPGKQNESQILLPIDSKYPQESYQRLLDATESGDKIAVDQAAKALEKSVNEEAKRISGKYIKIPYTTDFAIMFLPSEGLYAEVLRRPGLMESVQQKYRVVLSGPTTLSALLSSLQMGFRTLAVEQRSEEVWQLLSAVKEEFLKFGGVLDKTRQRLEQATSELDSASVRTRAINKQLKQIEQLELDEPTE